ncbi:MAG: 30S ribosomal protein S3 [Candidatus Heimdallarchaeota archaeon]|nr:30S ribosomal protein S3 [Candidatus Heimdallarchaeota archaeon]
MSAINHFIKKGIRQTEIDEYLASELHRAGYGGVEISKTPLGERITIHASRPGIVIGRRGKNIRLITDELVGRFGLDNPQIEVKEVDNPEQNARVMAYSLISAIERGVHRRRAAYSVLRRVLNSGAKGCEIIISGKLTSKRSRHEAYRMGLLAKSGEIGSRYVESANAIAVMKLGVIGVTVNIMGGDFMLPDEIDVLNVKLDEEETPKPTVIEVEEEITELEPTKPEKAKEVPKEKVEKAEKAPTKAEKPEVEAKKEVVSKKTDLDLKVEELSDLIEKTPGEEKKPKAKIEPVAKTSVKEEKPTTKPKTEPKPPTSTTPLPVEKTKKEPTPTKIEPKAKQVSPEKKPTVDTKKPVVTEPKEKKEDTKAKTDTKKTSTEKIPAKKDEKGKTDKDKTEKTETKSKDSSDKKDAKAKSDKKDDKKKK